MKAARALIYPGSDRAAGYAYAACAAALWSLIGPLSKECLSEGISPLEVAFWRAFIGGLCFMGQSAVSGGLKIAAGPACIFLCFGAWGIGVLFGALQVSIQLSGAAMAMVLLYSAPAWVAVFSRILFKEAVSRQKLTALGVALAGTALVCFSGGSLNAEYSALGVVCGLAAGVAYATHFPFYVWWNPRYSTATIYTYMLLGGAAVLYPFVDFHAGKTMNAWACLLALGVVTNYVAYLATGRSLQRISQVQAAVIGNIEPVLATLWVWLFWNENFSLYGWMGCILVISAVFLLTAERSAEKH